MKMDTRVLGQGIQKMDGGCVWIGIKGCGCRVYRV